MNFINLIEKKYGDEIIVNIKNISLIYPRANIILVNGVTAEGNGLYTIENDSMNALLAVLEGDII